MAIILLDEELYKNYFIKENKEYLDIVFQFIKKHMNVDMAIFLPDLDISSMWSSNNINSQINREIQKTGQFRIIDSNRVKSCDLDMSNYGFSEGFTEKINYLHGTEEDIIIPFSKEKHNKNIKQIEDYIYVINEVETELDSNFTYFISKDYLRIIFPTRTSPLPNEKLCCRFKEYQNDIVVGKSLKERQALYYQIAREVLKRNGYIENQHITSINTGVFGSVFSYDFSTIIYASVDIEHGAIEIFNEKGKHQDEYTYEGHAQNKQDATGRHDINV